jgi:hypothetical protein
MIAEDRGHPDILGVTLGVTLSALFELPGATRLTGKIAAKARFHPFHSAFPDLNSISHAELELSRVSRPRDEQSGCGDGQRYQEVFEERLPSTHGVRSFFP